MVMVNVSSIYWISIDPYWDQFDPIPHWSHLLYGYLALCIAVISLISNAAVVSFYSRFSLSPFRVYIVSLALSDALSPAITYWMILKSSYAHVWHFSQGACTAYGYIQGFLSMVSMITLAAVALEGAIRIRRNVYSDGPKLQFGIVILLWIYSAAAVAPPIFGWSRYTPEGFLTSCCFDFITQNWATRSFIIYLFTSGFAAPLIVILLSYIQTVVTLKTAAVQENRRVDASDEQTQRESSERYWEEEHRMLDNESLSELPEHEVLTRNVHASRMMFVVIILFLIAWTPYAIISLIGQFGDRSAGSMLIGPYSVAIAGLIAKASTVLNPFVYLIMDSRYRQLICDSWFGPFSCCKNKPFSDIFVKDAKV